MEDNHGNKLVPEQWNALADMKLRRLDREYQEVINAKITMEDVNKFQGLAAILNLDEDKKGSTQYQLDFDPIPPLS